MTWLPLPRLLSDGRPDDQVVALRHGKAQSFGRFRAEVAGAAAQMAGCRRAALVCRDSYAFAVGFFGLLHAGAEIVLPPNGQPGTLASLSGQFDRLLGDELLEAPTADAAFPCLDAERLRIDFFTSGSTGAPKRVTRSLGMLDREVATYDALWAAGPVVATVTHQHVYGLTFRLLWPLAAGQPFAAETHEVWETLLAALPAAAVVVSSPAHLGRLAGLRPLRPEGRPSLIFSAGAPLAAAAATEAATILGCLPTEIFGSTETGAFATRRQHLGDEPWRLLPGNHMRIDADGRLAQRSPYVEDWLHSGDLVEPVADGFRFRGRADRVAKIEGKRISLAEIEAALLRLPWVDAAAAVLLPGQPPRLVAAVVPSPQGRERLAALGGFRFGRLLRGGLADTQEPAGMPRRWRFVEALPQQPMGKRRDADVMALFAGTP